MLVVAVLDTSASMARPTVAGPTCLDAAKAGVQQLVQQLAGRGADLLLMLVTTDPAQPVVLEKPPCERLVSSLKELKPSGRSDIGGALGRAAAVANNLRLCAGTDSFGAGWHPDTASPAHFLVFTDEGPAGEVRLPVAPGPAGDLSETMRWDFRVSTVAVSPGPEGPQPGWYEEEAASSAGALAGLCADTGGKAFTTASMKGVVKCAGDLAQGMAAPGAVRVRFQGLAGRGDGPEWREEERTKAFLAGVRTRGRNLGWPIPEPWLQSGKARRPVHPTVFYEEADAEIPVLAGFPVDVYDLDAQGSGLIRDAFGGEAKGKDVVNWLVSTEMEAGQRKLGAPFGFLSIHRQTNTATLHLLPYDFPRLFKVVDSLLALQGNSKMAPPAHWRPQMDAYCEAVPHYYYTPLRQAMRQLGISTNVITDRTLTHQVKSFHNHLNVLASRAKAELDLLHQRQETRKAGPKASLSAATAHHNFGVVPLSVLENPLRVPREQLPHQLAVMSAVLQSLAKRDERGAATTMLDMIDRAKDRAFRHSVPLAAMGDYEETMQRQASQRLRDPLAEEDEGAKSRAAFGNPFKREKGRRFQREGSMAREIVFPSPDLDSIRKRTREEAELVFGKPIGKQPRVEFRLDTSKSGLRQSDQVSLDLLRGVTGQLPGVFASRGGSHDGLDDVFGQLAQLRNSYGHWSANLASSLVTPSGDVSCLLSAWGFRK